MSTEGTEMTPGIETKLLSPTGKHKVAVALRMAREITPSGPLILEIHVDDRGDARHIAVTPIDLLDPQRFACGENHVDGQECFGTVVGMLAQGIPWISPLTGTPIHIVAVTYWSDGLAPWFSICESDIAPRGPESRPS